MFLGIRKRYWWFLSAALTLIAVMTFLHFSPVFAVKEVSLTGPFSEKLDDIAHNCGQSGGNVFRFHKEKWAETMLVRDDVENIRFRIRLPRCIRGEINRFEPTALVLTDRLFGLDRYCRLLPYDSTWNEIDLPVLTGLPKTSPFQTPKDYRLAEVMSGLIEIEDQAPDLYRQIAEIDFSNEVYVSIYLTTGTDRYLAAGRDFARQLFKLDVVNRTVARSDDGCYNLMYDGVVIRQR